MENNARRLLAEYRTRRAKYIADGGDDTSYMDGAIAALETLFAMSGMEV